MNTKKMNFIYKFRVLLATIGCLFGISIFFINSNILCNMLVKVLHLKIAPAMIGGEVTADFFDGLGNDLIRYTVHKPVFNAPWQKYPDYWQIDFELGEEGLGGKTIAVYFGIDTENNPKIKPLPSSTKAIFGNTNLILDQEHPWNYAVLISESEGKVFNSDKTELYDVQLSVVNKGRTIMARIPLTDKGLQRVYSAPETYHYVFVENNGRNQDETIVYPLYAKMTVLKEDTKADKEFISKVYEALNNSSEKSDEGYFGFATLEEALIYYEKEIKENPDSALVNSNYGTCLAMKGGKSSVVQATMYVNTAFEYLDKGVSLSKTDEERFEALMNRGSVCRSVPESVFGKALIGAEDFVQAATIQKSWIKSESLENPEYQKSLLAYLYVSASQCYKTAGKDTESKIIMQEAKKAL